MAKTNTITGKTTKAKVTKQATPTMGDYTIEVNGKDGLKTVFLKEIPKDVFYKVFTKLTPMFGQEADPMGAGEIILRSCMIGGDIKDFSTKTEYIIGGAMQCIGLIQIADGSLKKN
jgi:hypothetical protein